MGPSLFLLCTSELFSILENMLIRYADDSTLMAIVRLPGFRVTVAESLIRDIGRVNDQDYDRLQVTHNVSPVTSLTIGGTVLKESDDLVILGVTFDSKMNFEKHLHSVSIAASQRLSILRKS